MDNGMQESLLCTAAEEKSDLKGRIWEESKKIWRVAFPGIVSRVTSFGKIVVTQSFVGHISAVDLAGYALVQTISERFVEGIVIGMSSATETLCGQAFGAKQYHMMGIFLQRSWLVDLATQKNMVIAWLSVMHLVVHIPLSWIFVYVLDWGTNGAMAALSISSWLLVCGEFIYIFGGWCPDSWKGFSFSAFKDIFPVVKLSISSGLMVCLELWYYAILVLLAGYMKNAEASISAFSICLNVLAWIFMISFGIFGSAVVRVANELGRGDAKATKFSIKVLIGTSVTIAVFFWILCLVFRDKLGYLFTNEEEVAQTVSDLSLLLAFSVLLSGIYPVLSGVAVGAGLQTKAAIINLVCFYVIGLPIGAVLGYIFQLQVKGIWLGMMSGVVAETFALSFMVWRTNWDEEVSITSARLKRWYLESSEDNKTSSVHF
ncbi:protein DETOXIFICATION 24-like isoform X3 [Sesamum indicum]|uniref:Protein DETOXIFICATION 24-like isoform X3 n=1 Tax=Sesamum indicum TaxID=4182 RepID=A0A8M8UN61_SESIN|nr:protein DETOXIFICATION 24-like isoform X3 [Sesamum indicum]